MGNDVAKEAAMVAMDNIAKDKALDIQIGGQKMVEVSGNDAYVAVEKGKNNISFKYMNNKSNGNGWKIVNW